MLKKIISEDYKTQQFKLNKYGKSLEYFFFVVRPIFELKGGVRGEANFTNGYRSDRKSFSFFFSTSSSVSRNSCAVKIIICTL